MKLLTPKEVAKRLNVSLNVPYTLVNQGKIPAYKIGKSVRISEEDLEEYLKSRKLESKNKL